MEPAVVVVVVVAAVVVVGAIVVVGATVVVDVFKSTATSSPTSAG